MEEGQTALILEGVACLRGDRLLFEELGLSLGAGEAALVTGPNGVGKSSLLRMIAGLLRPEAGRIDVRGKVALAAEQAALDEDQPLAKALAFWARLDSSDRVAHAMTAMAIDHLAQVPVRMLSTGQRKRAVLAKTLKDMHHGAPHHEGGPVISKDRADRLYKPKRISRSA